METVFAAAEWAAPVEQAPTTQPSDTANQPAALSAPIAAVPIAAVEPESYNSAINMPPKQLPLSPLASFAQAHADQVGLDTSCYGWSAYVGASSTRYKRFCESISIHDRANVIATS